MALSDVKRLAVRAHRIFKAVSALPLVLLVAVVWKSSSLEGWSGWAFAAAVGPLLIGLSALMAGLGAALWSIERREGRRSEERRVGKECA